MRLGEQREFFVLRKAGTDQFYVDPDKTTENLLMAKLIEDISEKDAFKKLIIQASIRTEGKTSEPHLVRVRIATHEVPYP
jgi:hypothetical protein